MEFSQRENTDEKYSTPTKSRVTLVYPCRRTYRLSRQSNRIIIITRARLTVGGSLGWRTAPPSQRAARDAAPRMVLSRHGRDRRRWRAALFPAIVAGRE